MNEATFDACLQRIRGPIALAVIDDCPRHVSAALSLLGWWNRQLPPMIHSKSRYRYGTQPRGGYCYGKGTYIHATRQPLYIVVVLREIVLGDRGPFLHRHEFGTYRWSLLLIQLGCRLILCYLEILSLLLQWIIIGTRSFGSSLN